MYSPSPPQEYECINAISEEDYKQLEDSVTTIRLRSQVPSLCSEEVVKLEVLVHRGMSGVEVEKAFVVAWHGGERELGLGKGEGGSQGIESLGVKEEVRKGVRKEILQEKGKVNSQGIESLHIEEDKVGQEREVNTDVWMKTSGGKRRGIVEKLNLETESIGVVEDSKVAEKIEERIEKSVPEPRKQNEDNVCVDKNENCKEYVCSKCDKTFEKKRKLGWHLKNVHKEMVPKCEICDKTYSNEYNLKRHTQIVHQKVRNKMCQSCGKCYEKLRDVVQHEKKCRGCEECGKACRTLADLQAHNKDCSGISDFRRKNRKTETCSFCQKHLSSPTKLRRHISKIHNNNTEEEEIKLMKKPREKCNLCEKTFNRHQNMKRHVESVHNKKSTPQVNCQFCVETFDNEHILNEHLRYVHHHELRMPCLICNKSLKSRKVLNEHYRKEHNNQEYTCLLCHKIFKRKSALKRHNKKHTNPPRMKKSLEEVSKGEYYRRRKETEKKIVDMLKQFPEKTRKSIVKGIIKENPDLIDEMDPLSEDDIIDIIKDNSMSDRLMLCILRKLRKKWGRTIITPNIRECLRKRKLLVDDFFTLVTLDETTEHHFEDKDGNIISRQFTYCNDIEGLLTFKEMLEMEKHGEEILEDVDQVIGLDGGVKKLIMCHTWSPKVEGKLRRKLSQKNTIILASVAEVPETDHNLRVIFALTQINKISYLLSADLKLVLMGLGLGSNSSTFSCGLAECRKESKRGKWIKGEYRTIGSICEHQRKWLTETGGDRKKLNKYKNCEHEPVVRPQFDENSPLFPWLPIPKLHAVLLGPTNHLVKELVQR